MEKQPDNNVSQQLLKYRSQIDKIDQLIIDLLNERMEIVHKVGKHKEEMKDRFFIRSNREADMIKNLANKIGKFIPKSVIVNIWRKIITSANVLEQNIKIGVNNPQKLEKYHYLIREYYSDFVPIIDFADSKKILEEISQNNIQLGVFKLPDENERNSDFWWVNLANMSGEIKVFATFPFLQYKNQNYNDNLVVVTNKNAEKSDSDKSLLVIQLDQNSNKNSLEKTLKGINFEAKIITDDNSFSYLIEISGFYLQNDEEIRSLEENSLKAKIIGHFPTPIIL